MKTVVITVPMMGRVVFEASVDEDVWLTQDEAEQMARDAIDAGRATVVFEPVGQNAATGEVWSWKEEP